MAKGLAVGDKAPEFCLPDAKNNRVCIKDFRGRWLVLYFYPRDNTTGCTREAVDFSKHLSRFKKMGTTVIGISPDSPVSHANFINKHNLKIILLSDVEHKVLKAYGVWQKKRMYGREYHGVVRTTFIIDPKGNIKHKWEKVKVAGHANAVKNFVGMSCVRNVDLF
ncbi:peroxiredoxin [candidate division WOR_3 bacterium SM23_60]|uniref:thioredoxin-dependent peroxiredoxin n=1 Tax=candidate division WOR_3 bacterium SM23_60 TaxID=1703780 RepID=A0A0S8GLR4_UNCW3|nr:MAG: peroxiredoxin [candidate division WOR_3 bacterium SM23_60]